MNLAIQANEDDFYEWHALADAESEFDFINMVASMVTSKLDVSQECHSKVYLAVVLALFKSFVDLLESEEKAVVMDLIAKNPERDPESPRTVLMADLLREFPEFHPYVLRHAAERISEWGLHDFVGKALSPRCLQGVSIALLMHSGFLETIQQTFLSNTIATLNK